MDRIYDVPIEVAERAFSSGRACGNRGLTVQQTEDDANLRPSQGPAWGGPGLGGDDVEVGVEVVHDGGEVRQD